ncbi:MAG TPA: gamma carbonic anhydrase family protein [Thermodesulfobacteriota bacterium]|nr:gamma carbonic anhydrase family protein [Thermodesulfobacteriota bacterium]
MILPYKGVTPTVHETVFIEESARVIGDVHIGEFSSVWFNSVVRGDVHYIRIGRRTNVQDNCTLHVTKAVYPLVLGDEITVGHGVVLHGCTIRDRCLIGMGAIILDNAEVGEDSIIGAGSVVAEGTKVPPGSLVLGVPGRVVRELRPEEKERIRRSAENYIGYARDYTG